MDKLQEPVKDDAQPVDPDEVLRRMLETPPRPKKGNEKEKRPDKPA